MTTKELETYLLLHEQKIETFVKARSRNWLIAGGVAVLLVALLFFQVFKRQVKEKEEFLKEVAQRDRELKLQKEKVAALEFANSAQDSIISNLNEALKNNRTTETRIITKYEKIPNTVRDLNREQLRGEVTNY